VSTADTPLANPEWDRLRRGALTVALAGLAAFVIVGVILWLAGGISVPRQFFLSYLVAYMFWLGAALGSMALLMLQHLTGGAWGVVLRRVFESGARTLPLLLLFFVPIIIGLFLGGQSLYPWVEGERNPFQEVYLSIPFFIVRVLVYFAIWLAVTFVLNRWSAEQDRAAMTPQQVRRFRLLSGPGIALYGGTITLAAVDWLMSLTPNWYSTIFPPLVAVSQVLTGMALSLAVALLLATRFRAAYAPATPDLMLRPDVMRDLGNLLLAFVMLWAYMSFSQFLLVWVGNLPEEIPWYLQRVRAGWQVIAVALIVLHFGLPFLLLLSRDIKQDPRRLAAVAVGILVMRFVDVLWWVEPTYSDAVGTAPRGYAFWLLDVAAAACLGGLWVWWFLGQLRQRPLLPVHDPYFAAEGSHP
jgi:hypothetical protein